MTIAAFRAAIDWAVGCSRPISLECDVHFSADDELICLHDLRVDRTSDSTGMAFDHTVAELQQMDFGSWKVRNPTPDQRRITTLRELLTMVRDARAEGHEIELAVETKHPNPRGLDVEQRVAEMLAEFGWDHEGAPVRLLSFSVDAVEVFGDLLPALERTLLIGKGFGPWIDGHLPERVRAVGPDLELIRKDPDFIARAHAHGNEVHVWWVNRPEDIQLCMFWGIDGYTTDYPDRVAEALDIFTLTPPTRTLAT